MIFFFYEQHSKKKSKWILIVDWPGLEKIYSVKVTRMNDESTIIAQFGEHAVLCPEYIDKVLYSLCNKTLRHDTEYDFFTEKIITLLKSPTSFTTIVPGMSFEDFLITEYCIIYLR